MATPEYEQLWRPATEANAAVAWCIATVLILIYIALSNLSWSVGLIFAGIAMLLAMLRAWQTLRLFMTKTRLVCRRVDVITLDELETVVKAANQSPETANIYLGDGFEVEQRHSQRWQDLRRISINEVTPPEWAMQLIAKWKGWHLSQERGSGNTGWIDAVEEERRPILLPMSAQAGHTMVVGTTGAGKTTLLIAATMQRVLQGHVVITIDPKGDHQFERAQREVARRTGRPFVVIDPARPSESDRLSLLSNFNRYTELPSRLVAVLPDSDFKAFGWCFTSRFVAAMLMLGEKPDIASIKRYIIGGSRMAGELLERCIIKWMRQAGADPDAVMNAPDPEGGKGKTRQEKLIAAYLKLAPQHHHDDVIDGLLSTYTHDKDHYAKVTLNLVPVLEKLTAGELLHLFSPDAEDLEDMRPIWDFESIIEQKAVVYVRLDSLSDPEVGSAIGSMVLSNVVAVAGARQNAGKAAIRIAVQVDELGECVNIPFLQLANKGRSSLFDLLFFCQSVQDLTFRMGSTAFRDIIEANANNVISFRVTDPTTADFALERMGTTEIVKLGYSQGLNQKTYDNALHFQSSVSRNTQYKDAPVIPKDLLIKLPTLHYIASFTGGRVVKGAIPILQTSA